MIIARLLFGDSSMSTCKNPKAITAILETAAGKTIATAITTVVQIIAMMTAVQARMLRAEAAMRVTVAKAMILVAMIPAIVTRATVKIAAITITVATSLKIMTLSRAMQPRKTSKLKLQRAII